VAASRTTLRQITPCRDGKGWARRRRRGGATGEEALSDEDSREPSAPRQVALIWIEKLTLHVFPIQDGIGGILEPLKAELEVFDVIEVVLDRLPDDLGSGPVKPACRAVDLLDKLYGESGAELRHG